MSSARRSPYRSAFPLRGGWFLRVAIFVLISTAVATVWTTNAWLTERFTESTRSRAQVRMALYSGNVVSELQRASVVPLLLSRDPTLIRALENVDFSQSSQLLISYVDEIGAASLQLLDDSGRVVAATDRSKIGTNLRSAPFFVEALRSNDTVFITSRAEAGNFTFTYSRAIMVDRRKAGVIVVGVDLAKFEQSWAGISDAVIVTDSEGQIILATEPRWRGHKVEEALEARSAPSAIARAIQATADWGALPPDAYVRGEAVMRNEARIPFRGWRIISFTPYVSIRDKVNAVLALEIMGFAMLLALSFYLLSRRAQMKSLGYQRETVELRELNARLQREIAERERAEKNLEVAEQTLEQSSKLAALGEMSAAISHELNQPLAAMKTYLAGARLLLQRKRPEEALSSFQRIDDLIERMGAITRQLKSYARKGGDAFEPLDMRFCVSAALSMMEPQLKRRKVTITRSVPREPVMVMADRIRLEQVIINLLRNALDATRESPEPRVDLILSAGETATLTVRDNGHGIEDIDKLFEPFYTTKQAGDGVGLGLAISSSIVADLGGRLTARNAREEGAVFEVQLPVLNHDKEAAE
ncbi:two-component system C4-dicarboxylate transport sensor histidine kinase DctB [Rhodovulum sulfidophilum]|uniref:sensor histidine kinase n=1 Tax=Rhodovulum sulfidophilum TaxID=35806 RepID=UPI0005A69E76|nr:ATP-binding protein [Rhodovulum sulfidophilum]ANB34456.1 two-component system sensor histidine kinase [Rhodovulum sulfidophilum DSM 1374]ANB38279.1 two-component system sensor histidine kinase [Rhodovulum sulfidophilum]MCW2303628.1 two-component system C4-dicarboxylate transport sensor histidine kinase DctB [Rhodovulum sulfidophilum]